MTENEEKVRQYIGTRFSPDLTSHTLLTPLTDFGAMNAREFIERKTKAGMPKDTAWGDVLRVLRANYK